MPREEQKKRGGRERKSVQMFFISLRMRALCTTVACMCDSAEEKKKGCMTELFERIVYLSMTCVCVCVSGLSFFIYMKKKSASYLKENSV